jgi:ABC-type transport system involved in multi-copper enzyme maturation permease subunit
MLANIKADFRRVLTIRSTYIVILISIALIGLFAFYGQGIRYGDTVKTASGALPPVPATYLQQSVADAVNALGLFIAIIAVLLMTHEYRYNTIMYTLTASNSRSKTLFSKIFVVTVVSIFLALLFGLISPLATALGLTVKGIDITPQSFYFKDLLWHVILYGWGFAMAGLLFAVLIRHQIGVFVTLMLFPTTVEPLLTLVVGETRSHYLPFMALGAVINHNDKITDTRAALVFLGYLIVGWIVGWILFVKRDAN